MTKLDRDPASGTALQEISFWLNLERALNRIQEKRESPEVLLTLDILKHGKRFHATVSFDTDTGELCLMEQAPIPLYELDVTRNPFLFFFRTCHSNLRSIYIFHFMIDITTLEPWRSYCILILCLERAIILLDLMT